MLSAISGKFRNHQVQVPEMVCLLHRILKLIVLLAEYMQLCRFGIQLPELHFYLGTECFSFIESFRLDLHCNPMHSRPSVFAVRKALHCTKSDLNVASGSMGFITGGSFAMAEEAGNPL